MSQEFTSEDDKFQYLHCLRGLFRDAIDKGFYPIALCAARLMILANPVDLEGYHDMANVYCLHHLYESAFEVYRQALKYMSGGSIEHQYLSANLTILETQINCFPQNKQRWLHKADDHDLHSIYSPPLRMDLVDPAKYLPSELLLKIFEFLGYPERCEAVRVSSSWHSLLYPNLEVNLTILDLRYSTNFLTIKQFARILNRSSRTLQEVFLDKVCILNYTFYAHLLLFGQTCFRITSKCTCPTHIELDFGRPKAITSLSFTQYVQGFKHMYTILPDSLSSGSFSPFLATLRVDLYNTLEIINLLIHEKLPALRVLECYQANTTFHNNSKSRREVGLASGAELNALANLDCFVSALEIFKIGRPFTFDNSIAVGDLSNPVFGPPQLPSREFSRVPIQSTTLQIILKFFPNLVEFHCTAVSSRMVSGSMLAGRRRGLRLDLAALTPNLKVLDLSGSDFLVMPKIPLTCNAVFLDFCSDSLNLRSSSTFRKVRYYTDVLDSEGDGYFAEEDLNEYKQLETISLFGKNLEAGKLFDGLARCNPDVLRSLDLHGVTGVDYSKDLSCTSSDFCKNYQVYNFFSSPERFELSKLIVYLFPNLERVSVGSNSTFNDSSLDDFVVLDRLQVLECLDTSVTSTGVRKFDQGFQNLRKKTIRKNSRGEISDIFHKISLVWMESSLVNEPMELKCVELFGFEAKRYINFSQYANCFMGKNRKLINDKQTAYNNHQDRLFLSHHPASYGQLNWTLQKKIFDRSER
ncbi:uncharacterized protein V1516DRAFT_675286 [Lipomyces oligophaga]|uniref:uncharacterized protein n=1 Tax=Lipomyces oligophaga TaxID=45792 RepID=UPI0034CD8397